jgi:hypothetical protein
VVRIGCGIIEVSAELCEDLLLLGERKAGKARLNVSKIGIERLLLVVRHRGSPAR